MNLALTAKELRARGIEYRTKAKFARDLVLATKYREKAEWYAKAATEPLGPQTISAEPNRQQAPSDSDSPTIKALKESGPEMSALTARSHQVGENSSAHSAAVII